MGWIIRLIDLRIILREQRKEKPLPHLTRQERGKRCEEGHERGSKAGVKGQQEGRARHVFLTPSCRSLRRGRSGTELIE